jgi:hypothetical protein
MKPSKATELLPTHGRFSYQAITQRPDYQWPNKSRLAVYIGFNVEHFAFGSGLGANLGPLSPQPDVLNYSWREYGNRVGAWRCLSLFDELALPTGALINTALYDHCPELVAALVARGAIAPQAHALLRDVISARLAFLVSGGTGAGKTTLLAAALGAVGGAERIVCIEDAPELAPRHPHLVRLVARSANVEGAGEVTLRQLVRQSLRMRPDRVVVGEVRGAEVVDLLAALNTGHDGGAGTVHANSPAEVPARLEALGALGGLERAALHSQLASAIRVVLHVSRDEGGRRLSEIALLRRDTSGLVSAQSVWQEDRGLTDGADAFARLTDSRLARSRRAGSQ